MSPILKIFAPIALLAAGGYYYLTGQELETPTASTQLQSMPVPVPANPQQRQVASREAVLEDRQALAVYADMLKGLYSESYFKKIQMAREAELDAKIAGSMQKVRDAGYTVDGGSFTLSQSVQQSTLSSGVTETAKVDSSNSASKLDNSYYEAYSALSSMRLVMTEGDSGTFDLGGEYVTLSEGDVIGTIQVDKVDNRNGRAVISSPRHGLSRSLMIAQNQYTRAPKSSPSESAPNQNRVEPLPTATDNSRRAQNDAADYLHPISSLLMNTLNRGG